MNRLAQALKNRSSDRPALMTHVVLGYPSLSESLDVIRTMSKAGAAIIECQIPFSDPIADGPTIMQANDHALANGTTPRKCIEALAEISAECEAPLLIMTYFNIAFTYPGGGLEAFCKAASDAGVQGLIIPDVPPEENSEGYWTVPQRFGLYPVPLVSPVTGDARLAKIAQAAGPSDAGFVYCVSTTGTTGARKELPPELAPYLDRVRKAFALPLAVGFGISTPEQVRSLTGHADIAIVGSAMIDLIAKTAPAERLDAVARFVSALAVG